MAWHHPRASTAAGASSSGPPTGSWQSDLYAGATAPGQPQGDASSRTPSAWTGPTTSAGLHDGLLRHSSAVFATSSASGLNQQMHGATPDFPQGDPWGSYRPVTGPQQQQPVLGTSTFSQSPNQFASGVVQSPPGSPPRHSGPNLGYLGNPGQQTSPSLADSGTFQMTSPGLSGGAMPGIGQPCQLGSQRNPYFGSPQQPQQQMFGCMGNPSTQSMPSNSAAMFAASLDGNLNPHQPTPQVRSAFELLGKPTPAQQPAGPPPDQNEVVRSLINALSGEKKTIPSWNGSPATLRSWLKLLAFWEAENTTPKSRWGLKLYQSFPENSHPRKVADTVPMDVILTDQGYSQILQALTSKYRPYLEIAAPAAIDAFFFTGERSKGESFASFIANKEIQRQEMCMQIGENVSELVCGRILLKQANLSEFQRELLALKAHSLLRFDEVVNLLRPLDRSEVISKAAMGGAVSSVVNKTFVMATGGYDEHDPEQPMDDEEWEEDDDVSSSTTLEDGFILLEDKEYTEMEAIYVQAYSDVRRDLQNRRKERGYVKHSKDKKHRDRGHRGGQKGRGKGGFKKGKVSSRRDGPYKATSQDLMTRTRCWNCDELGHISTECPLNRKKPGTSTGQQGRPPQTFVAVKPQKQEVTTTCVVAHSPLILSAVTVKGFEAILDTGAEDAVIGSGAMRALEDELRAHGLQSVTCSVVPTPCCGVGGQALAEEVRDIPISLAGLPGVVRFTILKDQDEFRTPPLLPISFLEAVGANINLDQNTLTTKWGHSTQLHRLNNSKHRVINILDFRQPWVLPHVHRGPDGVDPFQLADDGRNAVLHAPRSAPERGCLPPPNSTITLATSNAAVRDRSRSRSCSPSNETVNPATDVIVWLRMKNGEYTHLQTLPGPLDDWVCPRDVCQDQPAFPYPLTPQRLMLVEYTDGTKCSVHSRWTSYADNQPILPPRGPWCGHVIFVERDVGQPPAALKFLPTGLFPGSPKIHPDLGRFIDMEFDIWNSPASVPAEWYMRELTDSHAHSAKFWGKMVFADSDSSCSSHVLSQHFGTPSLTLTSTTLKPFVSRTQSAQADSPDLKQIESFVIDDGDCEEIHPPENQNVVNLQKVFDWKKIIDGLSCKSRRSRSSNDENWIESVDEVTFSRSKPWTSLPTTSRGSLKKAFLSSVRSFIKLFYGRKSSLADWQDDRDSLGRREIIQEDGSSEDYGSLEAHGLGTLCNVGHSTSPINFGLHCQEVDGAEPPGECPQEEDPTPTSKEGQESMDPTRHRTSVAEISSPEELASRTTDMHTSSRVSTLPSQSLRQVVDLPGMRQSLAEEPGDGSFFFYVNDGARLQGLQEGCREGHREELSRVSSSPSLKAAARCSSAGEQSDGKDCLQDCRGRQEEPSRTASNDLDPKDEYSREKETSGRSEANSSCKDSTSIPGNPRDPGGCGVRLQLVGSGDGRGGRLMHGSQLGSREEQVRTSLRRQGIVPKVLMVLMTMGMVNSFPLHDSETENVFETKDYKSDYSWLTSNAYKIDFEESTGHGGHFVTYHALPDPHDQIRQSAADVNGLVKTLPKTVKKAILANFKSPGQSGKSKSSSVDVMEIYSPPRVTARALKHHLSHGGALDLATGWNFCKAHHRRKALKLITELKPALVILSPPCTAFSTLRRLSDHKRNPDVVQREKREAIEHVQFSVQIARMQMKAGRGFLFEHPLHASSWTETELSVLKQEEGVFEVRLDMCAFGLQTKDKMPALKPTLLLTNVATLALSLGRRCDGRHPQHQPLLGGRAGPAAIYTDQFVDSILKALRQHLQLRPESIPPEDYWTVDPNNATLTRHHVNPRIQLFRPDIVTQSPVSFQELSDKRCTSTSIAEKYEDNWRSDNRFPPWQHPWTGTTSFKLADHMMLPGPVGNFASWFAAAGAHALSSYINEETNFIMEWHAVCSQSLAFPTRRILGGGAGSDFGDFGASTSSSSTSSRPTSSSTTSSPTTTTSSSTDSTGLTRPLEPVRKKGRHLPTIEEVKAEEASDLEAELDQEIERAGRELQGPGPSADIARGMEEQSLHPELRRELYRLHRNLGHPDPQTFIRALKHAGVRGEIISWTKQCFRCPLCERRRRPHGHRPAHLTKQLQFNHVVGVDLFFLDDHIFLNILCWGTDLQIVETIPDKAAETVCVAFLRAWVTHYGPPHLVVADQGKEFVGEPFIGKLAELGILVHLTDVRSPWQNSRTERAGGSFKSRLETVLHEISAQDEAEYQLAVAETQIARNRYYNRAGYSPYQRAFGVMPRLPASLLSDDQLDRDLMFEAASDEVRRAWEVRDCAARAWMKFQDTDAIKRSLKTTTRTADMKPLNIGDVVYVWRKTNDFTGWSGPGVLVALSSNGRSAWVSLRGYLVKASREQVRSATSEESLGAELVQELSKAMLEEIESGSLRNFRDIEGEGGPEQLSLQPQSEEMTPQLPPPVLPQDLPPEAEPETPYIPQPELPLGEDMEEEEVIPPLNPAEGDNVSTQAPSMDLEPPDTSTPSATPHSMSRRTSIRVDEAPDGQLSFGPVRERNDRPVMPYPFSSSSPSSWPSPSVPSQYFNVTPEDDGKQVFWKHRSGKMIPIEVERTTYALKDAVGMIHPYDKKLYITKAKLSPGQVTFKTLPAEQRAAFRKSRDKEIKSLLDSGAIRIMSVEESLRFLKESPENVLESRYVDRWKPTDAFGILPQDFHKPGFKPESHPGLASKSRWCVIGWMDPMIHEIERSAPTPLTSSMYIFMQVCASRHWEARVKDAKTAFLQSKPTTRKRKLACRMPKDETFPGYDPRQLILLLTEVYGLVSGPAWWRRSFLELCVKELGYRVNCYDRCVLTLDGPETKDHNTKVPTRGIMVIEVDDILEAGDEVHRQKMSWLEQKLRFGKVENLRENKDGSGYAGRRLKQLSNYGFEFHMTDYVNNRLRPMQPKQQCLKRDASAVLLDKDEEQMLRGVIAAVNWTAREGRPDASASASILSGVFPSPTMQDLFEVNLVVKHLKENPVILRIQPIPEESLRHVVIADSSFDPSGKVKPQHGWTQGFSTPELNAGKPAPFSIISWRSKRLRRKAGSTTLCEAISLSTALGSLEKQVAMLESFRYSRFDPRTMISIPEVQLGLRGSDTVIASEDPNFVDPQAIAIIDAKSVFDGSSNEQAQGEDDRSALEFAVIQESLSKIRGRLRWIPHNKNPSDGLTKLLSKAHMEPMMSLLRSHTLAIEAEEDVIHREKQSDHRKKIRAS